MKTKRLILSLLLIFSYILIGVVVIHQEISSSKIELGSNVKITMSFVFFAFLLLGYMLPKFLYFFIIKAIFKIDRIKSPYLLYALTLGFLPIFLSICINYFFGYSFEHIKAQYFDSAITSVLNPIDLLSLLIVVYLLKNEVKFSFRDSIILFFGYIVVFIIINLISGIAL